MVGFFVTDRPAVENTGEFKPSSDAPWFDALGIFFFTVLQFFFSIWKNVVIFFFRFVSKFNLSDMIKQHPYAHIQ